MPDLPTKCHLCPDAAVAVFYFSHGCACDPATVQPLCLHHAHRAQFPAHGVMELIKDLTVGEAFRDHWDGYRRGHVPGPVEMPTLSGAR